MPRQKMSDEERLIRRREAREKWRLANPEKDKESRRAWDARNREKKNEAARARSAAKRVARPPKTPEQIAEARAIELQKKREYQKAYAKAYPERIAATKRNRKESTKQNDNRVKAEWARRNRGRVLAWCRARQLAKIQRTPSWLSEYELWVIEQIYDLAAARTKLLGFQWHVDHIVPLRGKTVSGLHVPWNLQVIPGSENSRKGAKLYEQQVRQ